MKLWLVGGCAVYAFLLPLVVAETFHREYLPTWSKSFYRPRDVELKNIGLVNVETVFFATHAGVSTLHDGLLTPAIEVRDSELTAFHLCHHRSSIFYETLAKDGGVLTIYEYSLLQKESHKVAIFQETVPAKALACVDQLLLRSSQANLVAISLTHGATKSMLQKFKDGEDYLSSLAVAFPADSLQNAEVFGVVPRNRSVVKLRLNQDSVDLHLSKVQELLSAGDGADGSLEQASVVDPLHVAWLHGKLLLADKCSLRQVWEDQVQTLLGSECDDNETLQPAPWASRIGMPLGIAAESEGTAGQTALLLTQHQVIQVTHEDSCAESSRETCVKAGCAWAEAPSKRHCFSCEHLQSWAETQRPMADSCALELTLQPGQTRYDLEACGCKPPAPPKYEGDSLWSIVRLVVFFGGLGGAFSWFRQRQRRREEEMYVPAPNVQFHTFNENGYVRYDEDEPFS